MPSNRSSRDTSSNDNSTIPAISSGILISGKMRWPHYSLRPESSVDRLTLMVPGILFWRAWMYLSNCYGQSVAPIRAIRRGKTFLGTNWVERLQPRPGLPDSNNALTTFQTRIKDLRESLCEEAVEAPFSA